MIKSAVSLTVIPPSPVTSRIIMSLRGSAVNNSDSACDFELSFRAGTETVYSSTVKSVQPGKAAAAYFRLPTAKYVGKQKFSFFAKGGGQEYSASEDIEVIESDLRSPNILGGAWNGIYHWSEQEGRLWNSDIKKLTDEQWREQVRGMHEIGLDIIVIQETWRNQEYCGKHNIPETGYKGRAYYPSELYPGRMPISAEDPLEAVLSQADELGMKVFPGVGLYAWFDYTKDSLEWHKKVASELWKIYGHHKSFYGFYVSEESCGDLGGNEKEKKERISFFKEFHAHCRSLAPDKPVMLAPNCWYVKEALDAWPELLKYIDILCPFAFHRMNPDDISGEESAAILQKLCDDAGTHIWMDMELFLFDETEALYPRPIEGLLSDLKRFPNFEKILGYQYQGLLCAPEASARLGGADAVKLFEDYKRYLKSGNKK